MQTPPQNPPRPSALEQWRKYLEHLISVTVTLNFCNRIPHPLFGLIQYRLQAFRQKIERLTARIEAGTFVPRKKTGPREKKANRPPWHPSRLPTHRGWLAELLSDADKVHMHFAPGVRGWLGSLLQQPEIKALIETAPAEMARPIRSLVWMLDFPRNEIPAILQRPRKPRTPRQKAPPPPPPPPPETASPATEAAAEKPVPISWKKPRGSISNRLYRNYRPPGTRPRGAKNSA